MGDASAADHDNPVPTAKEARQARRAFNKAVFRAKRDCSEQRRMDKMGIAGTPPCDCTKSDDPTHKRWQRFLHCSRKDVSKECVQCEKDQFLFHIGACEAGADGEMVAQTTEPFAQDILACDTTQLNQAGYRVHPQQMIRGLNKAWGKARCDCRDKATQDCDDGQVISKATGEGQGIKDKECRNKAYHAAIAAVKEGLFTEIDKTGAPVIAVHEEPAAAAVCEVKLVKKHSRSACTADETFGCTDGTHVFVDEGCRGDFTC